MTYAFVDYSALEKLRGSSYSSPDDIATMTQFFDKKTKTSFKAPSKPSFIKFGRATENEPDFDIRAGSIKLTGEQVASFFKPAVKSIIRVIEEQSRKSPIPIRAICLVGGFATSDYLFSNLDTHFSSQDLRILRPDGYLNKAVAEGAVSYHIDHRVSTRVARLTYGFHIHYPFNPFDSEHIRRSHLVFTNLSGERRIMGVFSYVLLKGTAVSEETEYRKSYFKEIPRSSFDADKTIQENMKCYRGRAAKPPNWIDCEKESFEDNCEIEADLTGLPLTVRRNGSEEYYRVDLDVVLLFGLTERLKAQIAWKQNGVEKRGPASVVFDTTASKREEY
ncbi:hypothetical protein APHAL10511_005108 [Amanita phalloides]|nr:hypothetical protein APHAL10511_005108 [Amanita phalloides]